jgi:predicted DNA-binding ribbon-helix-helix protein
MASGRLELYNVRSSRGPTTIRLEPEFWQVLQEISELEGVSINAIMQKIDATRGTFGRTGACRVFILQYCRSATTALGHDAAGHGDPSGRLTRSDRALRSQVAGRNVASRARLDSPPDRLC